MEHEALRLARRVFDQSVGDLPARLRTQENKILLAARILSAAAAGERNPERLRAVTAQFQAGGPAIRTTLAGVTRTFG